MIKNTALLMIDMQRGFLDPASPCYIAGAEATVPACAAAAEFCRREGSPVFFVTRRYRADGSDVEHSRYQAWAQGGQAPVPRLPRGDLRGAPRGAAAPGGGLRALQAPLLRLFPHGAGPDPPPPGGGHRPPGGDDHAQLHPGQLLRRYLPGL